VKWQVIGAGAETTPTDFSRLRYTTRQPTLIRNQPESGTRFTKAVQNLIIGDPMSDRIVIGDPISNRIAEYCNDLM